MKQFHIYSCLAYLMLLQIIVGSQIALGSAPGPPRHYLFTQQARSGYFVAQHLFIDLWHLNSVKQWQSILIEVLIG